MGRGQQGGNKYILKAGASTLALPRTGLAGWRGSEILNPAAVGGVPRNALGQSSRSTVGQTSADLLEMTDGAERPRGQMVSMKNGRVSMVVGWLIWFLIAFMNIATFVFLGLGLVELD